jgi:hypothetical protein
MEFRKYKWWLPLFLDVAAFFMTYPWLTLLSLFCACYWYTTSSAC